VETTHKLDSRRLVGRRVRCLASSYRTVCPLSPDTVILKQRQMCAPQAGRPSGVRRQSSNGVGTMRRI